MVNHSFSPLASIIETQIEAGSAGKGRKMMGNILIRLLSFAGDNLNVVMVIWRWEAAGHFPNRDLASGGRILVKA